MSRLALMQRIAKEIGDSDAQRAAAIIIELLMRIPTMDLLALSRELGLVNDEVRQ